MKRQDSQGPVLFAALYTTGIALTLVALFLHERFGATEFKAWAPFVQAILSAGAIFAAWLLQDTKRRADRRDSERDTLRMIRAASLLAELDIGHYVSMAKASDVTKNFTQSLAMQIKESDAIIRSQNLGHLPNEKCTFAVLGMMRTQAQFIGVLTAQVNDLLRMNGEGDDKIYAEAYKSLFDYRTEFLVECGFEPEPNRRPVDKIQPYEEPPSASSSA